MNIKLKSSNSRIFLFLLSIAVVFGAQFTPSTPALAAAAVEVVSAEIYGPYAPGGSMCFSVAVRINSGQLLESRGDMLRNTDGNLFGHWPHVAVSGSTGAGQTYRFNCYSGMAAPGSEGSYSTNWRVWRNGAYDGPDIPLTFSVRNGATGGGGGGTPPPTPWPVPGQMQVEEPCEPTAAMLSSVDIPRPPLATWPIVIPNPLGPKTENFVTFDIPTEQGVLITRGVGSHSAQLSLLCAIFCEFPLRDWTIDPPGCRRPH